MKFNRIFELSMIGSLSVIAAGALVACESETKQDSKGAFVIIEEVEPNKYKIKDQYPSDETRVILKELNGTERVLSKEEMDALIKNEAEKIDNNTSNLTNSSINQGGLSLGETILASAAGAILGSYIGSKLFNNSNFANQQKGAFSNQSAYQRSVNSFNKQTSTSSAKSGFFKSSSKQTQNTSFGS